MVYTTRLWCIFSDIDTLCWRSSNHPATQHHLLISNSIKCMQPLQLQNMEIWALESHEMQHKGNNVPVLGYQCRRTGTNWSMPLLPEVWWRLKKEGTRPLAGINNLFLSALWHCWLGDRKSVQSVITCATLRKNFVSAQRRKRTDWHRSTWKRKGRVFI